ncbi:MAG: EscE/YscE/SsaE family type III secretion system needle protein co-chaperone [Desulfobacterales bacterium]|nr:EscE/YscE/SsaE family type III secretion system needle protein co-chaperone [Desulfobacterales bacterium]
MDGESFSLLDIEEKMIKDSAGVYKNELLAKLVTYAAEIKQEIDRGLPPQEFESMNKMMAAIEVSQNVVETIWRQMNMNQT